VRRSHPAGGLCKLLGGRPLPSILQLASDEIRRTRSTSRYSNDSNIDEKKQENNGRK